MDRLTGKDAKLMMEALASVYIKEEVDQEVISEEVEDLEENRNRRGAAARLNRQKAAAEEDRLYRAGGGDAKRQETRQMQGASRARVRRAGMTRAQVIELGRKNLEAKASTSTGTAPAAPANNAVASKEPAPAPAKTNMAGASKEDRMAAWAKANPKLAAAKAARDASRGTSASTNPMMKDMPGKRPAPAPTGGAAGSAAAAAKPATAVGSAAKPAAAATPAAKPAPTGSPAAQAAAGAPNRKEDLFTGKPIPSAKPTGAAPAPTPAAKPAPAGSAAAGSAGAAAAPVVKKRPMGARNRMRSAMEEVDIFETIKQYLVDEGYSEDEALKAMTVLTDEERTEILEGSCGSKKKPSKKKRY